MNDFLVYHLPWYITGLCCGILWWRWHRRPRLTITAEVGEAEPAPDAHPAPVCIVCDRELTSTTFTFPIDPDTGQRRWIDTGHPCGHVQLDTFLVVDDPSIGQLEALSAAQVVSLVAVLFATDLDAPVDLCDRLGNLAKRVRDYDGTSECPLCAELPHKTTCPLKTLTREAEDA